MPHPDVDHETIDKALNALASGQRAEAQSMVLELLKKDGKRSVRATKDIIKALDQISHSFISEKAQQLFELALSFRFTEPNMEQQKLIDSLKLEPDNVAIQVAMGQQLIESKDCTGAAKSLAPLKNLSPFLSDVGLVMAQAEVCANHLDTYLSLKSEWKPEDKSILWNLSELEYDYKTGKFDAGLALAQQTEKSATNLPETYYWDWRLSVENKTPNTHSAQKYLELCRSLTPKMIRAFLAEPSLCRRTAEVDTFLKRQPGVNEGR